MTEELNPPQNQESVLNQDSQENEYEYLLNRLRNIKMNISLLCKKSSKEYRLNYLIEKSKKKTSIIKIYGPNDLYVFQEKINIAMFDLIILLHYVHQGYVWR